MRQIRKVWPESELFLEKSELFDGRKGGIWTSGETGVFNYWNVSKPARPEMEKILDECGWWYEFHDSGTVILYPS